MLGCPMSIVKFSYQIPNEPLSGVQTVAQGVRGCCPAAKRR